MLKQILAVMQEFESTHGCPPQAIRLNARHMLALMDECVELFHRERRLSLGVRFVVVAEREAPAPTAIGRTVRASAPAANDAEEAPVLLAWSTDKQLG